MATTTKDRVLDAVRQVGSAGVTHSELVELTNAKKATVTRAVNTLLEETLVRVEGEKVKPVLRNGRRLITTEQRDALALEAIEAQGERGFSVLEVAQVLGATRSLAYQSVYRLRVRGKVRRNGVTRTAKWVATSVAS